MTDLYYTDNGFNILLFANTKDGEDVYNEIFSKCDVIPSHWLPSLKTQLKKANLTIRKKRKTIKINDEQLLKELEENGYKTI